MFTVLLLMVLTHPPYETNPLSLVLDTGIKFYQKVISTSQGDACNFHPSCSRFARQAIRKYGFLWGILMTSDRLMRCNPSAYKHFNTYYPGLHEYHIYDPVENNYIFGEMKKPDTTKDMPVPSEYDH